MSCQFEESHDTDDGEELENVCILEMRGELLQCQIDEKGECRHVVDNVDRGAYKEELVGTRDETHHNLDSEPRVADGFDVEEGLVSVRLRLVQNPRSWIVCRENGQIADDRYAHVGVRFQAKRQDRNADEEYWDQSHNLNHISFLIE